MDDVRGVGARLSQRASTTARRRAVEQRHDSDGFIALVRRWTTPLGRRQTVRAWWATTQADAARQHEVVQRRRLRLHRVDQRSSHPGSGGFGEHLGVRRVGQKR
jgi:hypothetical protein